MITFLIICCVLLNTAAQIFLKIGVTKLSTYNLLLAINPWVLLGLALYTFSVVLWLYVLAKTPVSIAYPMASLGYVTSALAAYWLLGEDLNLLRISGILIILLGVVLVARS